MEGEENWEFQNNWLHTKKQLLKTFANKLHNIRYNVVSTLMVWSLENPGLCNEDVSLSESESSEFLPE